MKLCLGTVQFGMDYGITGQKKPLEEEAVRCLDYAVQNGIDAIDTAEAYGTAEDVVGKFIEKKTISRDKLFLSTKLLPNCLDDCRVDRYVSVIREKLQQSLKRLHTDYVDAFLLHSPHYVFRSEITDALYVMKQEGLARKVGVSVYDPKEATTCYQNPQIEFMQAPYSIFDHRMKESGILDSQENTHVQIHTRSAFVQGLIALPESQIPDYLMKAKPVIRKLEKVSQDTGLSRIALAMAYVKRERNISHLVFGVDSMEQLKENIFLFRESVPTDILEILEKGFSGLNADIVMPSLWKKED